MNSKNDDYNIELESNARLMAVLLTYDPKNLAAVSWSQLLSIYSMLTQVEKTTSVPSYDVSDIIDACMRAILIESQKIHRIAEARDFGRE